MSLKKRVKALESESGVNLYVLTIRMWHLEGSSEKDPYLCNPDEKGFASWYWLMSGDPDDKKTQKHIRNLTCIEYRSYRAGDVTLEELSKVSKVSKMTK